MSRRHAALKPQLNRIRAWAHEGSTDAWIAHQLDTTAEAVRAFRQEHGIERGGPAPLAPITPDSVVEAMLAEEAAALEAGPEPEEPAAVVESAPEPKPAPKRRSTSRRSSAAKAAEADVVDPPAAEPTSSDEESAAPAKSGSRRRGTRGGAGRKSTATASVEEAEAETQAPPVDEEPAEATTPRRRATTIRPAAGASAGDAAVAAAQREVSRLVCFPAASCCSTHRSPRTRRSRSTGQRPERSASRSVPTRSSCAGWPKPPRTHRQASRTNRTG